MSEESGRYCRSCGMENGSEGGKDGSTREKDGSTRGKDGSTVRENGSTVREERKATQGLRHGWAYNANVRRRARLGAPNHHARSITFRKPSTAGKAR